MKIIPLTEEEIAKLPFPESARLLGGLMTLNTPEIDPKEIEKFRRLFRISLSKLSLVKK